MQNLIRLNNVTKQYGACRALDAVSLEIGTGITGLLGPNGAGKTTLIKILLGLVRATRGDGEVLGHVLPKQARLIRSLVGYLPEDDCYVAGLTGIEMVHYMARLWGQPYTEAMRRSHEIIDFCGLQQERYRDVSTYSTGMRQRLKFAHAIVHDPSLLILDEPTTGLDPDEREAMLGRIRWMATSADKAVILSTHILPDVQAVCDNVVIMASGRIRLTDQMKTLRRSAVPAVHVTVLGSIEALAAEAQRAGFETQQDSNGRLTILGFTEDAGVRLWHWAHAARVALRSVTPARTSLEQMFREAIQEDSRANP
jgi:ABC-2 type transport system ATP-binding protein